MMDPEIVDREFSEGNPMNTGSGRGASTRSVSPMSPNSRPPAPVPRDMQLRGMPLTPRRDSSTPGRRDSANNSIAATRRQSSQQSQSTQRRQSSQSNSNVKYRPQNMNDMDVEAGTREAALVDENTLDLARQESKSGTASENDKGRNEGAKPKGTPEKLENDGNSQAKPSTGRLFKGKRIIQYGVWAHYMGYGSSLLSITLGIFAIIWMRASTYHCKLDGKLIDASYLPGTCTQTYNGRPICCIEDAINPLKDLSSVPIGVIYILYGVFLLMYEDTTYGFGLWFPTDSFFYKNRISPIGILHIMIGIVGLANDATALAGGCLITNGLVYCYAAYRFEGGDGGRGQRKKAAEAAKKKASSEETVSWSDRVSSVMSWNPVTFYQRIYREDKLSSYIWVTIYVLANLLTFFVTLDAWFGILAVVADGLEHGTLDIHCNTPLCKANRKMVKYGPISEFGAWAKAAGMCLNLNGSLILLPVIRNVLRRLNNAGTSFNANKRSDFCLYSLSRPLTRYIPLQKNIEFHKMCAFSVCFFTYVHMICHYFNLITANAATTQFFRAFRWSGTQYLLGSIVTYAMFIIYTGAPEAVRMAKYEIFFKSHHFFIIFFLIMFLHGPNFIFWSIIPVLLYTLERYLQLYRGNRPYLLQKVEYIEPVLAIYFRPVFKEDFQFKEGQYLYLNCPTISQSEWHPFTISSASDDLNFGPRIHLETGEEVVEVPRPASLPPGVNWNKYCLQSKDWRKLNPNEFLDKSETGYMDYVSVHVKVHGLDDPYAKTWTRKLKEYFESLSPAGKFPFYFSTRDLRNEISIGRQYGPDNKTQIIRVDGPHSAPSEHYTNYGTVMIVGAGIGLTPCASILTALTKFRWKKNSHPEILHFYWIVRQSDVDSFQWLIHMLTDLSFELQRSRESGQIERKYYCEMNIYVTAAEKTPKEVKPLYRGKKENANFGNSRPDFTADELYAALLNPTVESKGQIAKMRSGNSPNRFQNIWIWNGRPHWDEIFQEMKNQRQHSDIGVCFCGAPVIGADLRSMCEKYSSVQDDCLFSLHKENF